MAYRQEDNHLSETSLIEANRSNANLHGANGTAPEQREQAKTLKGAPMPDESIHP